MARLDIYKDRELILQVQMTEPEVRIGRGGDCQVSLPVPEVSRVHAVIKAAGPGWEIASHGINGTRVNAAMVKEPRALAYGDRIYIDRFVLVFQEDGAPALQVDRVLDATTLDARRKK
jgi:pSer/pThr/pTyr-binding forkhead associated (FHA) protein